MNYSRFVISGLSGGSGKTTVSLGLAYYFSKVMVPPLAVHPFKKGPDYVDAAWLTHAATSTTYTLDPFFSTPEEIVASVLRHASPQGLTLVEGNRGLFDGLDATGSCSTAMLAITLSAPVVLVVDCTKMTRTVAALIKGCADFEPNVLIGGVILNRIGTTRQETIIRQSIELYTDIPVLGCLPRQHKPILAERATGLCAITQEANASLTHLATFISENVDTNAIMQLAKSVAPLLQKHVVDTQKQPLKQEKSILQPAIFPQQDSPSMQCTNTLPFILDSSSPLHKQVLEKTTPTSIDLSIISEKESELKTLEQKAFETPQIGYAYDAAFWYYYPENLEALAHAGATLIPISLLDNAPLPQLDGLYISGAFPDLHAEQLAANSTRKQEITTLAQAGLPIFAASGGLAYLCKEVVDRQNVSHAMAGVFPYSIKATKYPVGLGYTEISIIAQNPYFPLHSSFKGHEFHFCFCSNTAITFISSLLRGSGAGKHHAGYDGILYNNTFAMFSHIFSPAVPYWAEQFVFLCNNFAHSR